MSFSKIHSIFEAVALRQVQTPILPLKASRPCSYRSVVHSTDITYLRQKLKSFKTVIQMSYCHCQACMKDEKCVQLIYIKIVGLQAQKRQLSILKNDFSLFVVEQRRFHHLHCMHCTMSSKRSTCISRIHEIRDRSYRADSRLISPIEEFFL